jgi:hypothetical protein
MLYLGIDQHRKQLTVSVRNEAGDVVLRRQVSTELSIGASKPATYRRFKTSQGSCCYLPWNRYHYQASAGFVPLFVRLERLLPGLRLAGSPAAVLIAALAAFGVAPIGALAGFAAPNGSLGRCRRR